MEKKEKKKVLNAILDESTRMICEIVGSKMAINAAKILIPNGTIITRLGACLIGSGIGDLAASYTIKSINDGFEMWDKVTNHIETDSETETEEVVETE